MAKRFTTRTWHPQPIASAAPVVPVAQVQDEGMREYLLIKRRALLMEAAEIARRCGLEPDAPDDEAA